MSDLRELVQDLLAHAPEAPAVCSALMRRAARELSKPKGYTEERLPNGGVLCRSATPSNVKGAPCN